MRSNELPEPALTLPGTDVHECLQSAAASQPSKKAMLNFSTRMPEETRDAAKFICERNGTDLSSYLRECTYALVRDYGVKDQE